MGWIFMVLVIAFEAILMSKLLSGIKSNGKVLFTVSLSNIISGLVGAFTSLAINGGWMLVVWLPWVSDHEVDDSNPETLFSFIIYYIVAFVVTVAIEALINNLRLKNRYGSKEVTRNTIITNVISYLIGTFVLYSYSFLFYN